MYTNNTLTESLNFWYTFKCNRNVKNFNQRKYLDKYIIGRSKWQNIEIIPKSSQSKKNVSPISLALRKIVCVCLFVCVCVCGWGWDTNFQPTLNPRPISFRFLPESRYQYSSEDTTEHLNWVSQKLKTIVLCGKCNQTQLPLTCKNVTLVVLGNLCTYCK